MYCKCHLKQSLWCFWFLWSQPKASCLRWVRSAPASKTSEAWSMRRETNFNQVGKATEVLPWSSIWCVIYGLTYMVCSIYLEIQFLKHFCTPNVWLAKPQGPEVSLPGAKSCACRMWQKIAYLMKKDASDARVFVFVCFGEYFSSTHLHTSELKWDVLWSTHWFYYNVLSIRKWNMAYS